MMRDHGISAFVDHLVEVVKARVLEDISKRANDNAWVRHPDSPLGARETCRLARSGTFKDAYKVGRVWLVRQTEIDAYIEAQRRPSDDASDAHDVDGVLAEIGLERVPTRGRRAARPR